MWGFSNVFNSKKNKYIIKKYYECIYIRQNFNAGIFVS